MILVPLFGIGVAVHELVHALAVIALGGDVLDIRVWPSLESGELAVGQIIHAGSSLPRLVAAAPSLVWIACTILALLVTRFCRVRPIFSPVVFCAAILPMFDLSFSFASLYFFEDGTDLHLVFAGNPAVASLVMAAVLPTLGAAVCVRYHQLNSSELSTADVTVVMFGFLLLPWLALAMIG